MSHLVQASDTNNHLFTDDTQLFISFKHENFNETMSALPNAFHSISNWMSANLLVLNPAKMEFFSSPGIWPYLDFETASTISTALVHSKLDFCNFLCHGLYKIKLGHLKLIQNALGHVIANNKCHDHITPTLQSLHWLKI